MEKAVVGVGRRGTSGGLRVWGVWGSDGGSMDHVLGQGGALERPG